MLIYVIREIPAQISVILVKVNVIKLKMLKILKTKIIFLDWTFKITLNNKAINMLKDTWGETPLYSYL